MRSFTGSIIAAAAMATGGWALPVLRLDTAGGSYDTGTGTVPEPGTLGLMGLGLSALAFATRRRRKA